MTKKNRIMTAWLVLAGLVAAQTLVGLAPAKANPAQTEPRSEAYVHMELTKGIKAVADLSGNLQFGLKGISRSVPVSAKAGEHILGSVQFPLQEGPFQVSLTVQTASESKNPLRLEGVLRSLEDKAGGQRAYEARYGATYYDPQVLAIEPEGKSLVLTTGFASGAVEVGLEAVTEKGADASLKISIGLDRNNDGAIKDEEIFTASGTPPAVKVSTPLYPVLPLTAAYEVKVVRVEEVLALAQGSYSFLKGAQFTAKENWDYPVTVFEVGFFRQAKVATIEMPNTEIIKASVSSLPREQAGDWTRRRVTREYGPGAIPPALPSPTSTPTPTPMPEASQEPLSPVRSEDAPAVDSAKEGKQTPEFTMLPLASLWKPIAIGLGAGIFLLGVLIVAKRL